MHINSILCIINSANFKPHLWYKSTIVIVSSTDTQCVFILLHNMDADLVQYGSTIWVARHPVQGFQTAPIMHGVRTTATTIKMWDWIVCQVWTIYLLNQDFIHKHTQAWKNNTLAPAIGYDVFKEKWLHWKQNIIKLVPKSPIDTWISDVISAINENEQLLIISLIKKYYLSCLLKMELLVDRVCNSPFHLPCAHDLFASYTLFYLEFRLVSGPNPSAGRVEVLYNKTWGTVCNESFNQHAGDMVCHQLGLMWANNTGAFTNML